MFTNTPPNISAIQKMAGNVIPAAYRGLAIDPATGKAPTTGPWGPGNVVRNGLVFGGNILEYLSPDKDNNGQWVVFKTVIAGDYQEVFDWNRAAPWVNNPCPPTVTLGIHDR